MEKPMKITDPEEIELIESHRKKKEFENIKKALSDISISFLTHWLKTNPHEGLGYSTFSYHFDEKIPDRLKPYKDSIRHCMIEMLNINRNFFNDLTEDYHLEKI